MPRRNVDTWLASPTPRAPRIAPCPLPAMSPLMKPPIPITVSQLPATPRPPTTRRRRYGPTDEPGYSSSLETSAPPARPRPRPRPTSQVVHTPLAPAPPLRGILKTGGTRSSLVFSASLIPQDRDGYASSPEKTTILKPSQASHSQPLKSKPPLVANPTSKNPSTPPATLHWKLLPFDARRPKGKLQFDFAREVDEIILAEAPGRSRPLKVLERNKSAAEPSLTEMVIHCADLPDWPVHVARQSGIRCVDVFEAIRDTYNVVLTNMERSMHQSRVRDIERRRPPTPEGAKKGVRRRDLLDGKTLFLGLDWKPSDGRYPNGCWCLKVGSPLT